MTRFVPVLSFLLILTTLQPGLVGAVLPGSWPQRIVEASAIPEPGQRVDFFSRQFMDTPYRAGTLGGGDGLPETLTVNLDAVDCFTLLDYVEALRRSSGPDQFRSALVDVRYRNGSVSWGQRRHFFSDWSASPWLRDVTSEIGKGRARTAVKNLNRKRSGEEILPGVAIRRRVISWLPQSALDESIFSNLTTGDYLGIYSKKSGLDVSHVGIVVRKDQHLALRHASNRAGVMRVVDTPLAEYLAGTPGIIVLRPVVP